MIAALSLSVSISRMSRQEVIDNLLTNARKFTPEGGHVELTCFREADSAVIRVRDSGSGIPPDDLPHLFDRLYQSRSSVAPATSDEGKGLGLAIVKRIAELHGGSVEIDSREGHGTAVTIILPENP